MNITKIVLLFFVIISMNTIHSEVGFGIGVGGDGVGFGVNVGAPGYVAPVAPYPYVAPVYDPYYGAPYGAPYIGGYWGGGWGGRRGYYGGHGRYHR